MKALLAILALQCVTGGLAGLVALAAGGAGAAGIALLGTAICVLPNGFLATRLLVCEEPERLLRAVWFGEIGKLALTVILFVLALTQVEGAGERPFWLLTGFIAAQLGTFGGFLLPGGNEEI